MPHDVREKLLDPDTRRTRFAATGPWPAHRSRSSAHAFKRPADRHTDILDLVVVFVHGSSPRSDRPAISFAFRARCDSTSGQHHPHHHLIGANAYEQADDDHEQSDGRRRRPFALRSDWCRHSAPSLRRGHDQTKVPASAPSPWLRDARPKSVIGRPRARRPPLSSRCFRPPNRTIRDDNCVARIAAATDANQPMHPADEDIPVEGLIVIRRFVPSPRPAIFELLPFLCRQAIIPLRQKQRKIDGD